MAINYKYKNKWQQSWPMENYGFVSVRNIRGSHIQSAEIISGDLIKTFSVVD
jgi:hypothetical protein